MRCPVQLSTATATAVLLHAVAVSAVSPYPKQIAPPATTCSFYKLAFEFSKHVQPNISAAQSAAVWDALALQARLPWEILHASCLVDRIAIALIPGPL